MYFRICLYAVQQCFCVLVEVDIVADPMKLVGGKRRECCGRSNKKDQSDAKKMFILPTDSDLVQDPPLFWVPAGWKSFCRELAVGDVVPICLVHV